MNRFRNTIRTGFLSALGLSFTLATFGCHYPSGDTSATVLTTASADAARRTTTSSVEAVRPFGEYSISAQDGTVSHEPLYFVDSYEGPAPDKATPYPAAIDFGASLVGSGQFIFNAAVYPVHALVLRPWNMVASDGHETHQGNVHDHALETDDEAPAPDPSSDTDD